MGVRAVGLFSVAVAAVVSAVGGRCSAATGVVRIDPSQPPEDVLRNYSAPSGDRFPGLAVCVVQQGRVAFEGAAGVRKRGEATPVLVTDQFPIGSNTKAMTGLLGGILVDRGLISWNTTVDEVLGDSMSIHDSYRCATFAQLLSNSGGLSDAGAEELLPDFAPYYSQAGADRARFVKWALAPERVPVGPPGAQLAYSNCGLVAAGYMEERVTGASWEDLLRREVFEPLGIAGAGFGPPAKGSGKAPVAPAPWGHSPDPVDPDSEWGDNPAAIGPAGTVHASVGELMTYLAVFMNKGKDWRGRQIVSEAVADELIRPRVDGYALGWLNAVSDQGDRFLIHSGSNGMFYSSIVVFADRSDAVVVLTNRGDGDAGRWVRSLVLYLTERFLGATLTLHDFDD